MRPWIESVEVLPPDDPRVAELLDPERLFEPDLLFAGGLFFVPLIFVLVMMIGDRVFKASRQRFAAALAEYGQTACRCGLTGAETARKLLEIAGLSNVAVVETRTIDQYRPRQRQVWLTPDKYDYASLAAVATAAHEVGHAMQFAEGYWPCRLRRFLWPFTAAIVAFGCTWLAFDLFPLDSPVAQPVTAQPVTAPLWVLGLIAVALVAQALVTFPLEWDASRRAHEMLRTAGLIDAGESAGVQEFYTIAARTYSTRALYNWLALAALAGFTWWTPTLVP